MVDGRHPASRFGLANGREKDAPFDGLGGRPAVRTLVSRTCPEEVEVLFLVLNVGALSAE